MINHNLIRSMPRRCGKIDTYNSITFIDTSSNIIKNTHYDWYLITSSITRKEPDIGERFLYADTDSIKYFAQPFTKDNVYSIDFCMDLTRDNVQIFIEMANFLHCKKLIIVFEDYKKHYYLGTAEIYKYAGLHDKVNVELNLLQNFTEVESNMNGKNIYDVIKTRTSGFTRYTEDYDSYYKILDKYRRYVDTDNQIVNSIYGMLGGFMSSKDRIFNYLEKEFNMMNRIPEIKRTIFNDPYTIVIWKDNTKTIAKCSEGDTYCKKTGLMYCIMYKVFGKSATRKFFKNVMKGDSAK